MVDSPKEPERTKRPRKTLIPRKRILSDDSERLQISLPKDLIKKLIDDAVEKGRLSLSEHMRIIASKHLSQEGQGMSVVDMNQRLEASMKEIRTRIAGIHGGMEVLFAVQCRLLEATGNEDIVAEILEEGVDRERFRALFRADTQPKSKGK